MAVKKPTNRMKATIWTTGMRSDIDGPIDAVIYSAFWSVSNPSLRAFVLADLIKADAKMTEYEAVEANKSTVAA